MSDYSNEDGYFKNDKRRHDSFGEKSKKRHRHNAGDGFYSKDLHKSRRYENDDYHKERSSDHYHNQERYSVSSDSRSDENEDLRKSRSPAKRYKSSQTSTFMSNNKKVQSDEDSAHALTSKTKIILSTLGWDVNKIPVKTTNPPNDADIRMKDKKFEDDHSEQLDESKEVTEERRVWTSKPALTRDYKYVEDQSDIRRVELKPKISKMEDKKTQKRNADVDLIALNIKQCRDMVINIKDGETCREDECEEIRNVRVQSLSERNKAKKRYYIDLDQERSPNESKRFKKFDEEDANDWKTDKSKFYEEKRRISVKGRSKVRKRRSSSRSSFSEDSCSSYERKPNKSYYSKRHNSRDHFSQKEKSHCKSAPKENPASSLSRNNMQTKVEVKKDTKTAPYDYFDEGSHWCEKCDIVYEDAVDYLRHLHSDTHQKLVRSYPKPWAEEIKEEEIRTKSRGRISVPLKGLEFLSGTSAFYCKLCSLLIPDIKMAEKHLKGEDHNDKYREFLQKNPRYQKRRMLDVEPRMFQAIRIDHQDDECLENSEYAADLNKINETLESKVKHDLGEIKSDVQIKKVIKFSENPIVMKESTNLEKDIKLNISSKIHVTSETARKKELPVVMEMKPRTEKVTLDIKSSKNNSNTLQTKDASTTSALSSLKKLPFIGKRPSKMVTKSEADTNKPPIVSSTTNSASLSRDELLSRVMKDTVIIPPKGIQIPPFPGVPPEAMMRGCVNNYMMASYMGYAPYGGYYDMNLYYDSNNTCAAAPSENNVPQASCSSQEPIQAAEVEIAADVEHESDAIQQDHYENYTIGNDSSQFENIDEVKEPANNLCTDKPSETVTDDKQSESVIDKSEIITDDEPNKVKDGEIDRVKDDETDEVTYDESDNLKVIDDPEKVKDVEPEEVAEQDKPCERVTICAQDGIMESNPLELVEAMTEQQMISNI